MQANISYMEHMGKMLVLQLRKNDAYIVKSIIRGTHQLINGKRLSWRFIDINDDISDLQSG